MIFVKPNGNTINATNDADCRFLKKMGFKIYDECTETEKAQEAPQEEALQQVTLSELSQMKKQDLIDFAKYRGHDLTGKRDDIIAAIKELGLV